jgi:Vinculin family.
MQKHTHLCEDGITKHDPNKMVEHTSAIARLANRVLQVAKQEADNSEDPAYVAALNRAANVLQNGEISFI